MKTINIFPSECWPSQPHLVFAMPAKAQLSDNGYANIDWQFNVPLSNGFADDASGWV